jgi:cob(I)alamin adenosyltransferase
MPGFYTRGGDDGYTGLLGEGRIAKDDLRLEALGAVDEANAALGIVRALTRAPEAAATLVEIQRDLYGLMAEIAATPENASRFSSIDATRVAWLESKVDALTAVVEVPKEFIVPGDTAEGAFVDLARTVVRRAERRVAALIHRGDIGNVELLRYLNRLSSYCFVLEIQEHGLVQQEREAGGSNITLAKIGKKK